MRTVTISMRLPRHQAERLERLADELGTARPTLLKRALRRGVEDLMFERACQAYRAREATLSRAAEIASLPLRDMIVRLKEADLELSYGAEWLEEACPHLPDLTADRIRQRLATMKGEYSEWSVYHYLVPRLVSSAR